MGSIIKTNKKARDLYIKHLDKLDDYANGNFKDNSCYMCRAADMNFMNELNKPEHQSIIKLLEISEYRDSRVCASCPLEDIAICTSNSRETNLRRPDGFSTVSYREATPESIREHIKWMEKQINDKTDCVIYHE